MSSDLQLGFAGMGLDPDPKVHVRNVILGRSGPWPATELQRRVLHVLLFHLGTQQAISLRDLMVKLAARMAKPTPTERETKDAIRSLVVDFKVRIGASRSKPSGYFLITTAEEAHEVAHLYISEIRELARRVRVLLNSHDLGELSGQRWLQFLLEEPDVPRIP
jgi:hypothetical protein